MFWWLPFGKVPSVPAQQLDAMRKEGTQAPQLVGVRSDDEWRAGHIAGAQCAPVTQFSSRLAALRLDRTRPIIAMCRTGGRSKVAVRLLQRHGFADVFELQGGMRAWQEAGRPVEVEAGPVARG
jgi:rhodanese-related sulfurtransferase